MADPYLSEIYIFPFDWPPTGFAQCDGQILNIAQNQALAALLGITWGGDGKKTFGLPDLRGRVPIFYDNSSIVLGFKGGLENVQITAATLPTHTHTMVASSDKGDKAYPSNNYLAPGANQDGTACPIYAPGPSGSSTLITMSGLTGGSTGGDQGHNNVQPSLALNFCIATTGTWPSRD